DHIPELVELAKTNTRKDHPEYLQEGRVEYHTADGRVGFPQEAPYDCIHVGAAADSLHSELVTQLKAPGRMFIPVGNHGGQAIFVVDKDKDGHVSKSKSMDVWMPQSNTTDEVCPARVTVVSSQQTFAQQDSQRL
ncbi:hypothetical protein BGW38_007232, partial [Lunasporangiospora selenospora]